MNFSEFIGNQSIKTQLQSLIRSGRVPHAIIIEGESGLGKKTFADIIAKTIICEHSENGLACEVCSGCKKVEKGIHPDVVYPEKTGVLQTYNIATVRKIRNDVYIVANESKVKVYILSDIDNIGIPAQNALLKVLEEPPKNVIFIITCTSSTNILPTIRSRTQKFILKPVTQNELYDYLMEKYLTANAEKLSSIIRISRGNIGLAKKIMESIDGEQLVELAKKFALALVSSKEFDMLSLTPQILENKKNFTLVLNSLNVILRDALVLSVNCSFEKFDDCAKILSERLSTEQILSLSSVISQTRSYIEKNVNMMTLTTYFCSELFKVIYR